MTWGPEDLSAELGAEANRDADGALTEPYRIARAMCLYGAAAAQVPAIETIHVDFRNAEVLRQDTEIARRDGFTGRLAIHPAQVPVINEVFTPDARADRQRPKPSSRPLRPSPAPAPSASTARCTTARIWRGRSGCWTCQELASCIRESRCISTRSHRTIRSATTDRRFRG